MTLDARKAKEISVSTPRPSIDGARRPGYVHDSGIGGPFASFVNQYAVSPAIDHVYTAPTGKVGGGRFEFAMRWRRTAPLLSVTAGGQELDARNMPSARRWDGTARLTAAAAGTGTAGDFAGRDVRGKAVLVRRSDDIAAYEVAENAARAGARVVAIVNDRPGRFIDYAGGTDLPILAMTQAEGQPLIDKLGRGGKVTLTLDGTEQAAYVYDLVRSFDGEIPAGLSWAPAKKDLATITNRFVGEAGQLAIESRADCSRLELAAVHGVLRAGPPRHRAHRLRQHAGGLRLVRGRAGRARLGAARRPAVLPPWRGTARTAGSTRWRARAPVRATGSRAGAATSSR